MALIDGAGASAKRIFAFPSYPPLPPIKIFPVQGSGGQARVTAFSNGGRRSRAIMYPIMYFSSDTSV